jgi:hypothetical protein
VLLEDPRLDRHHLRRGHAEHSDHEILRQVGQLDSVLFVCSSAGNVTHTCLTSNKTAGQAIARLDNMLTSNTRPRLYCTLTHTRSYASTTTKPKACTVRTPKH